MPITVISRRGLLAAAALSPLAAIARESAAAGLNLGIQLYSLRGYNVDDALRHARDIGFRVVELYSDMFPLSSDAAAIQAMKKKVADLGLVISCHGVNGFGGEAVAAVIDSHMRHQGTPLCACAAGLLVCLFVCLFVCKML